MECNWTNYMPWDFTVKKESLIELDFTILFRRNIQQKLNGKMLGYFVLKVRQFGRLRGKRSSWSIPFGKHVIMTCRGRIRQIRQTEPSTSRFGKTSVPLTFKLQESDYSSFKRNHQNLFFNRNLIHFAFRRKDKYVSN